LESCRSGKLRKRRALPAIDELAAAVQQRVSFGARARAQRNQDLPGFTILSLNAFAAALHKPGSDPAAPRAAACRAREEFATADYDGKNDPANAVQLRANRGLNCALLPVSVNLIESR
jgi:hypothetical protein